MNELNWTLGACLFVVMAALICGSAYGLLVVIEDAIKFIGRME